MCGTSDAVNVTVALGGRSDEISYPQEDPQNKSTKIGDHCHQPRTCDETPYRIPVLIQSSDTNMMLLYGIKFSYTTSRPYISGTKSSVHTSDAASHASHGPSRRCCHEPTKHHQNDFGQQQTTRSRTHTDTRPEQHVDQSNTCINLPSVLKFTRTIKVATIRIEFAAFSTADLTTAAEPTTAHNTRGMIYSTSDEHCHLHVVHRRDARTRNDGFVQEKSA